MAFSTMESKTKYVTNISETIYQPWMRNDHVYYRYWLNSRTILPIIASMYPSICFIVYDTKLCTLSACKKDKEDFPCCQSYNYMKYPCDNSICLLYNGENHYDLVIKRR